MKLIKLLTLAATFVLFVGTQLHAQSNGEEATAQSPFDFDLNSSFGGLFFQDQIGLQIARSGVNIEGVIDKDKYRLGSNDLISIDIKGSQPVQMRGIVVNPQGEIVIPVGGIINVSGKTITEAQNEIKKRISETFKDPKVEISLDKPKPVTVHINGEVPHPGKYILPAQSRVDFAIYQSITDGQRSPNAEAVYSASDLLNQSYSFRNIVISHKDGTKDTADLISYYNTGQFDKNPFVRDGDAITIYQAQTNDDRVSVSGAVRSPFEVHFLKTDTPYSLLQIAGGFNNDADTSALIILRRSNGSINQIKLSPNKWKNFKLEPNDRIIVQKKERTKEAASAWISGEVTMPGNFPIINGSTTAYELLKWAGNFTNQALPHAGYLIRSGSIENELPNKFNADLMKRTSDQLVQGLEYLEVENQLSQNRVHVDLTDNEQLQQVKLFDGDRLFVPRDENTVFVFGQVNNPGYFPYDDGRNSVTNYILRAGGFSLAADQKRVYIIKAGNKAWYKPANTTLQSGDMIFVDREPYDELNAKRSYQVQREQLKNTRIQLIMTALTTITSIVTTLVAIDVIRK
ncbi:polysaccharide biosynthesis/export family protein [Gracilimonas tropica]|uniref:polysaccharide biosynthesis/export family protein n=1 Tax=Gracilimonas tropica TaxID=454600 RepID=UPI000380317F|nr:polysaccharide biosynthesis/export family protein [Gracilimonas tropica]